MAPGLGLLLERELRRMDRHALRRRLVRAVTLLLLSLVLAAAHGAGPGEAFGLLMAAQLQLLLFLQPVRAAGILVQGRLDGTLGLLSLTPLRPWAILAGTCGAALVLAAEGLLLALPLVSIAAAYGGLEPMAVLSGYVGLGVGAILATAVGAWVGAQGDRVPSGAFLRALAWLFLLFILPPLAAGLGTATRQSWLSTAGEAVWIVNALGGEGVPAWTAAGSNLLLALIFYAAGVRRLRTTVLAGETGPRPRRRRKGKKRSRAVPERRIVAWREQRRVDAKHWIRPGFIAVAAVIVFFALMIGGLIQVGQADQAFAFLLILCSILWLLVLVWGLMTGARSYVEDREDGSLELLLTTTYTTGRIVGEKLWGALLRGRLGILGGGLFHAGCVVAFVVHVGDGAPNWLNGLGGSLAALLLWITGAFLAVTLGQLYSVSAPTSTRAQAWAATTAGVLFFAGSFSCCIFQAAAAQAWKGAAGLVEFIVYGAMSTVSGLIGVVFLATIRAQLPRVVLPRAPREGREPRRPRDGP